jgi:hypothetical protein
MKKTSLTRAATKWLGSTFGQPAFPALVASCLLAAGAAYGASVTYDFNTDPTPILNFGGTLWDGTTTSRTGSASWINTGGAGPVGSTTNGPSKGVAGDGYLQITFATATCGATPTAFSSYVSGCVLFDDFDKGLVVAGFTFDADLRVGNGNPNPADGFSINYARSSDPVIVALNAGDTFPQMNNAGPSLNGGQFRDNGNGGDISLMEEGTSTGLAVGFDMWDSGGYTIPPASPAIGLVAPGLTHDGIGLDISVDDVLQTTISMPNGTTQATFDEHGNGLTASDPNGNNAATDPTSIETGPFNGTGCATNLSWVHLKVVLDTNGVLNVFWKNKQILTNFTTSYFPSPGRLLLASRVGGNTANIAIDNVQITTIPAFVALVGPATGFIDGFSTEVGDSGQSTLDTNQPILLTLNGQSVTPTSVSKSGGTTTVIYHAGFPTILGSGSTNTWSLTAKDALGNPITSGLRSFVAPTYVKIPGSDAVTGVDITKPGFRLFSWISPGQPNHQYWSNEQLLGYHGPNEADLTGFNDGGYLDWTTYLNFFTAPTAGAAGNFGTNNGYPDVQFPGMAGTTAFPYVNNPSASMDVLTFLKFSAPGLYEMGVNSDDGFGVYEGLPNPKDRFAKVLGIYDNGRGPSDTRFTFVITNTAGFYPFRLLYENGAGGTGALEWFLVQNGVRVLINDPSPTNTTGVTAYYSGPALPAYVSHIKPYDGQGGVRPDEVLAQITDGSTTVNQGSVKLTVQGSGLTSPAATISKSGLVTTAKIDFSPLLLSGSNYTATLVWNDSATPPNVHSNTWAFTVLSYNVTLDPSLAAPIAGITTNPPGFIMQGAQMDQTRTTNDPPGFISQANGVPNQVDPFDGLCGGLYFPLYGTNIMDTLGSFSYSGPPITILPNNVGIWIWTNQAAMEVVGYPNGADFPGYVYQMPGTPGLTGTLAQNGQDIVAWLDSYVVFPTAGFYEMGVNSDDGFRVSENYGLKRQVLHVNGTGINKDIAAVVSRTDWGNGGFGAAPPQTPISGPVFLVTSNNYTTANLTGKIGVVTKSFLGLGDPATCYWLQTNGAMAAIVVNRPTDGTAYGMSGTPPGPINIPCLNVNGEAGQLDFWVTNQNLTASVGSSCGIILGSADYGKGDSHIDFGFVVPAAGAYPLHLTYFGGNGGGNNFEWSVLTGGLAADGTRSLMNDVTNALSLVAYQTASGHIAGAPPTVSIGSAGGVVTITYAGTLTSSSTVNGTYTAVAGASSPYTVPTGAAKAQFYRSHN